MNGENSEDGKTDVETRQHNEKNDVTKSMTSDDIIKKNCIFKNRVKQNDSNDDSEENEGAKIIKNDKINMDLCLDRQNTNRQIGIEERHRKIILEALIKIQLASKKNIRRLMNSKLSSKDKNNLINKFQTVLNCVDKYLEQVMNTSVGELPCHVLYSLIYQMEAQYNVYLQNHIDILNEYKNKSGLAHFLIKWVCFFCY